MEHLFPKTRQLRVEVPASPDAPQTTVQVLMQLFDNRVVVMISDIGKIGTLIEAARDMKEDVNAAPTFSIRTLLGRRDDPVLQVYARRLIESIALAPVNTGSSRSLLLGIALQSNSPATLRAVVQQIEQQKLW